MNKNINLIKILKDCPKGTKLYSTIFGEVKFIECDNLYQIIVAKEDRHYYFTSKGEFIFEGIPYTREECVLFPSKEQRDWSKFTYPLYNKDKFDPKTLKPFDKVLVKCTSIYNSNLVWRAGLFSYFYIEDNYIRVYTLGSDDNSPKSYVIPYNDETKYLVNTEIEAPEYYKYWEN